MKASITIEVDTDDLASVTDSRLAQLWHVAQANPATIRDRDAGNLAEQVGREIIKRWLAACPPELWHHQGNHHYWTVLADNGYWPAGGGPWIYQPPNLPGGSTQSSGSAS